MVSLDEEDCRSYRSIGSIADYAAIFDDPMPDDIYDDLCRVVRSRRKPIGVTFEAGGKLLRHVYDELVKQRVEKTQPNWEVLASPHRRLA